LKQSKSIDKLVKISQYEIITVGFSLFRRKRAKRRWLSPCQKKRRRRNKIGNKFGDYQLINWY